MIHGERALYCVLVDRLPLFNRKIRKVSVFVNSFQSRRERERELSQFEFEV